MYTHTYVRLIATSVLHSSKKIHVPTDICHLYARHDNEHNELLVPVDKAGVDQIISDYPCRARVALVTVISKTAETPDGARRPLNSTISNSFSMFRALNERRAEFSASEIIGA